jgi:tetratricopeptide (TPR) repeat protein
MFGLAGMYALPILSLLGVFGFAMMSDVNMIEFNVKSVPESLSDMGYDAYSLTGSIKRKLHDITVMAKTSRGGSYASVDTMSNQNVQILSETFGFQKGVVAAQSLLGLVPYQISAKIAEKADGALSVAVSGFSSQNDQFSFGLTSDKNAKDQVKDLINRTAETIVDNINPYLLSRYYFTLESQKVLADPTAEFTKTIPQLARCMEVLPQKELIWPLLSWGRTYHFKGEYEKAIEIYRRIKLTNPKIPFVDVRWAEALAGLGRHQEAIALYQKVLRNPRFPVAKGLANRRLADSLIAIGQLDQAEAVLKRGLEVFAFGAEKPAVTAMTYAAMGEFLMNYRQDYQQAEHYLRTAYELQQEPEYFTAMQKAIAKRFPGAGYSDFVAKTAKTAALEVAALKPQKLGSDNQENKAVQH